jgi:hypothetical protein
MRLDAFLVLVRLFVLRSISRRDVCLLNRGACCVFTKVRRMYLDQLGH